MKIVLISNLYPPYTRGGAERVVETIAQELARQGHAVTVVTTVPSWRVNLRALASGGWIQEAVGSITVYRIASANLFPYWTIGKHNVVMRFLWHVFDMFAFETAATIKRLLCKEKPDVVMTHNMKGIGFLIPRAIRRLGIRHIHTVHDVQLAVPSGLVFVGQSVSFMIAFLLQQYERVVRWLFGSPDVVVAPSQWLLDFYTERGFFPQSKKVVLHNPIEIPKQEASANRRSQKPEAKNAIHFLYVGQIEKHKGILFLIEAIKRFQISIRQLADRFQIDIVGDGSLLQKIKRIASNDPRIIIHGAVPHDQLAKFYENADALIVPSLVHENAPTVIFEAFVRGIPVIASRVGGIPEFVKDGETGWIFEGNDEEQFLTILQSIIDNPNILVERGNRARRSVLGSASRAYIQALLQLV